MRSALPFLTGLLLGACSRPPAAGAPDVSLARVEAANDLRTKTVAILHRDEDEHPMVHCTGVWVSPTSILTANHCVWDRPIEYVTHEDVFAPADLTPRDPVEVRQAKAYKRDAEHDLALLRASDPPAHAVAYVTLESIRQGSFAQTMGHANGLLWSYSSGDVAAIRKMNIDLDLVWIQSTAPISNGNSGCGLFDARGRLIGIAHGVFPRGEMLNIFVHGQYVDALLRSQGSAL